MHDEQAAAADSTAVRVALWRAMHVQIDPPPHVLEDEVGLQLAAPDDGWRRRPDMDPQGTRPFRASIVARARFIEDLSPRRPAAELTNTSSLERASTPSRNAALSLPRACACSRSRVRDSSKRPRGRGRAARRSSASSNPRSSWRSRARQAFGTSATCRRRPSVSGTSPSGPMASARRTTERRSWWGRPQLDFECARSRSLPACDTTRSGKQVCSSRSSASAR